MKCFDASNMKLSRSFAKIQLQYTIADDEQ